MTTMFGREPANDSEVSRATGELLWHDAMVKPIAKRSNADAENRNRDSKGRFVD
jgi:hypothetical protein